MCNARRVNDQMMCECGLAWDVADDEPPVCPRDKTVRCDGYSTNEDISQAIGFEFQPGELQTVNADDLRRVATMPTERWMAVCGDWRDTLLAIHGERTGYIAGGLPEDTAHAIIKTHNAGLPDEHGAQQVTE